MAEKEEKAGILQLNDLHPAPGTKHRKMRIGRGESSKGKTSGRGTKGTNARNRVRPGFEGGQLPLYMRLPKFRGFHSHVHTTYEVVNVGDLGLLFPKGGEITVDGLVKAHAVRANRPVKLLGNGEISVAITIKGVAASASAIKKIEAAGGKIEVANKDNAEVA